MRIVIAAVLLLCFVSCNRDSYIEIKTSLEDKGADCSRMENRFKMVSNFGGERYEFQKCLPADYNASAITTARQGDTVVVKFNAPSSAGNKLFNAVIDIDSYPGYSFITIDNDTYIVTPTRN